MSEGCAPCRTKSTSYLIRNGARYRPRSERDAERHRDEDRQHHVESTGVRRHESSKKDSGACQNGTRDHEQTNHP